MEDVSKLRPHLMKGKATENQNINKRKGMEENQLSDQRTRTKYNDFEQESCLIVHDLSN